MDELFRATLDIAVGAAFMGAVCYRELKPRLKSAHTVRRMVANRTFQSVEEADEATLSLQLADGFVRQAQSGDEDFAQPVQDHQCDLGTIRF